MPPRKKKSLFRRALRWTVRLAALGLGVWLLVEAWRFPRVGQLATRNPDRTSFMRYREAEARAAGRTLRIDQRWVPLGRISGHLRKAAIAAEDSHFYQHEGFDEEAIRDAIEDYREGKKLRGASTISQQVAKNLWLDPDRTALRKGREAVYTWLLERRLSKDRILEIYLNVAEWGPGLFGAEAASRRYFGVAAADLTPMQAALLAAAIPSPLTRDPGRPSRYLERRARRILRFVGGGTPRSKAETPAPIPAASPQPSGVEAEPEPTPAGPEDLLTRRGE